MKAEYINAFYWQPKTSSLMLNRNNPSRHAGHR